MSITTRKLRTSLAACVVAGAAAFGAVAGDAAAHPGGAAQHPHPAAAPKGLKGGLAVVKQATARYRVVERALRDGYVPAGACAALPGVGAMGIHYLNPALAGDTGVDRRRPELLLYEPRADGGLRLVGVEWFVADADQDLATDDDRPSLFGRGFDGPMPGHEPGMPIHYDLHAWVFRRNPAGVLSPWNPRVSCP